MPIPELDNFRKKYPDYGDMDDVTLANKLATKYPDAYGDLPGKVGPQQPTEQAATPSQISGMAEQKLRDWTTIPYVGGNLYDVLGSLANAPRNAVEGGMKLINDMGAGLIGKLAGAGTSAVQGLRGSPTWGQDAQKAREAVTNALTYQPSTEAAGQAANMGGKVLGLPFEAATLPFNKAADSALEKGYPNLAFLLKDAGETVAMGLLPKAANKIATIGEVTAKQAKQAASNIKTAVENGVKKGISPGVNRMRNLTQNKDYFKNAETAVRDIVNNKNDIQLTDPAGNPLPPGTVPQTNYQLLESINQGKLKTFEEYNAMNEALGKETEIPLQGAAEELRKFANAPGMKENPYMTGVREKALTWADNLESRKAYAGGDVQDIIKSANSRLEAFHRNPSFETATPAAMESIVANYLRNELGNLLDKEVGPGYQALKNKYGSYKAIEQDVAHRTAVSQRQRPFGFFDYGNILSGSEAARALVNFSPTSAVQAGVIYKIKQIMQQRNQPDYHIGKMFKTVDKEMGNEMFNTTLKESLPELGPYDPWADQRGWASPPPNLIEYKPQGRIGNPLLDALSRFEPGAGTPPMPGEFMPSVPGTPGSKAPANFYQGTIPTTYYAPGTPAPDIKTYWVNEAAKQAAAEAARKKFGK